MNHSIGLHKKLYKLLNETGCLNGRHGIVISHTSGRTSNSSEMQTVEIIQMIDYLESYKKKLGKPETDFEKGDKMRKRILSLFRQYGYTVYSYENSKLVVDFQRIDAWMLKFSYLHKKLNRYQYNELPKLVTQVERLVFKYVETV